MRKKIITLQHHRSRNKLETAYFFSSMKEFQTSKWSDNNHWFKRGKPYMFTQTDEVKFTMSNLNQNNQVIVKAYVDMAYGKFNCFEITVYGNTKQYFTHNLIQILHIDTYEYLLKIDESNEPKLYVYKEIAREL